MWVLFDVLNDAWVLVRMRWKNRLLGKEGRGQYIREQGL
jgi:hypothetical protein